MAPADLLFTGVGGKDDDLQAGPGFTQGADDLRAGGIGESGFDHGEIEGSAAGLFPGVLEGSHAGHHFEVGLGFQLGDDTDADDEVFVEDHQPEAGGNQSGR